MSLIEKIKQQQLVARKEKNTTAARILTTLIGEADMVGKNAGNRQTTDAEVVAIIKKFIKNLDETIRVAMDFHNSVAYTTASDEKDILSTFLPVQFSETELKNIIAGIVLQREDKSVKSMGFVLGELKKSYAGLYDGALASKITKEMLGQ